MSVIKSKEKIICDICGKDITEKFIRHRFFTWIGTKKAKKDMCNDCYGDFKVMMIMNNQKAGGIDERD